MFMTTKYEILSSGWSIRAGNKLYFFKVEIMHCLCDNVVLLCSIVILYLLMYLWSRVTWLRAIIYTEDTIAEMNFYIQKTTSL